VYEIFVASGVAGRQAEALLYAEKIRGTSQVKKVDSTTGYFLGNSTAV
jgi:hypothetical protein